MDLLRESDDVFSSRADVKSPMLTDSLPFSRIVNVLSALLRTSEEPP